MIEMQRLHFHWRRVHSNNFGVCRHESACLPVWYELPHRAINISIKLEESNG
jgi:hypothetical protein